MKHLVFICIKRAMRHNNSIITIIIAAVILLTINLPVMAKGEIYAIGCIDNYPYEYVDDTGAPAGFSVDLINEIAKKMNMKCRINLVPFDRFNYLKKNPDVDIILGTLRGNDGTDYQFFRTNVRIHFSIFADSDSVISSINDLHNLKILIAASDFIARQVENELKRFLKFKSVITNNEITAFTHLKKKECDVVFMSGPSARKVIENQNQIGIKEIPVSIGFFDYGFGIRKNNTELRSVLTEGYNKIFSGGEYHIIYNRWFVEKSDNSFFSETGIYVSAGIFSFIIFIFFIIINSFVLRKRITEKTEELHLSMSELSKAQMHLKESEKRFKKIFNKSPSGLMILNSSGRVILFNEAIVHIFGVTDPDEISNLDIVNSPVSTEWFKTRLKNCRNINLELKFDFGLIKETGYYTTSKTGIIILELIIIPLEINAGSPEPGYICQISDNTRERNLLEEIKYNQRKLELVFEAVKDGLWEWNLATGKVRYNRKFFTYLGYKMEFFKDDISTLLGFIHEGDRESVKNELNEKVSNGRSFNIEYRMIMSNGRVIYARSRGETIEWDDNLKPIRVIGIQTEVTLQRNLYNRINLLKSDSEITDMQFTGIKDNCFLNGRTILVADDNYLIFMHISELLKKYKAEAIYAASGYDAVDIVKRRDDISLILLDHYMPGLDGISALNEIRSINNNIPVIVQSGQLNDSLNERFINEGFNGVLGKPVEEHLFIETICDIMESFFYKKNYKN